MSCETRTTSFKHKVVVDDLEVAGNLDVAGDLNLNEITANDMTVTELCVSGNTVLKNNVTANANLIVTGTTNLANVIVNQTATFEDQVNMLNATVAGNVTAPKATIANLCATDLPISGNLVVGGDTFLEGNTIAGNDFIVQGDIIFQDANLNPVFDNLDLPGFLVVEGTTDLWGETKANANLTAEIVKLSTLNVTEESVLNTVSANEITVSGNLTVQGKVQLETVCANNATLANLTVTDSALFETQVQANAGLDVNGSTTLEDLTVETTTTFEGDVLANSDLTVTSNLNVGVKGTIDEVCANEVEVTDLTVQGETELNETTVIGNLTVTGTTTLQSNLTVLGNSNLNDLFVGNLTINDTLILANLEIGNTNFIDLMIPGNLTVQGTSNFEGLLTANTDLNVVNKLQINGNLCVTNTSTFEGTLTANSDTTIAVGNLTVNGDTTFEDLNIVNATVNGNITVAGNSNFEGLLTVNTDLTTDKLTVNGNLCVTNTSTFEGNVDANSDVKIVGDLMVEQDAMLMNLTIVNANVGGNVVVAGFANVEDLIANSSLNTDKLTVNGNLCVTNTSTFEGNVDANSDVKIVGDLMVEQDAMLMNLTIVNANVGGNVVVAGFANVEDLIANTDLTTDKLTVNGNLCVTNTSNFEGNVDANSDVKIVGDLMVEQDAMLMNLTIVNANVGGNVVVAGFANVEDLIANSSLNTDKLTINGNLCVTNTSTFEGNVDANSDVKIVGDLMVEQDAMLMNLTIVNANVGGNVVVAGFANVEDLIANTDLNTDKLTVNGNLCVTNTSNFIGDVQANGEFDITGALNVQGNMIPVGAFNVVNANLLGNLVVNGTTTLEGDVLANSDLTVAGNLNVNGLTTFEEIDVTDKATIGTLCVTGTSNLEGDVTANSDLTVAGEVTISGNLTVGTPENFDNPATILPGATFLNQANICFMDANVHTLISYPISEVGDIAALSAFVSSYHAGNTVDSGKVKSWKFNDYCAYVDGTAQMDEGECVICDPDCVVAQDTVTFVANTSANTIEINVQAADANTRCWRSTLEAYGTQ